MNKLSPEHLHLLLDEPIYVLHSDLREQLESAEEPLELLEENKHLPDFRGENKKGILILIDNRSGDSVAVEDEEFLFKGLNALNIFTEDVAIIELSPEQEIPIVEHHKRIVFSANPDEKSLYQLESSNNISLLQCHRISQIRNDKDLKVRFWLGLKAMFES